MGDGQQVELVEGVWGCHGALCMCGCVNVCERGCDRSTCVFRSERTLKRGVVSEAMGSLWEARRFSFKRVHLRALSMCVCVEEGGEEGPVWRDMCMKGEDEKVILVWACEKEESVTFV